jgi:hypothetical protein
VSGAGNKHERERERERGNVYKILVRKPEGKRPLGRYRRRWEDTIRMNIREIGWEDMDWMHLAHNTDQWRVVVNTVMGFRVS